MFYSFCIIYCCPLKINILIEYIAYSEFSSAISCCSTFKGQYESADILLNTVKQVFPSPYKNSVYWQLTEQCLLFNRAYYRMDPQSMKLACDNLTALSSTESKIR